MPERFPAATALDVWLSVGVIQITFKGSSADNRLVQNLRSNEIAQFEPGPNLLPIFHGRERWPSANV